jgi:hypothetical protein
MLLGVVSLIQLPGRVLKLDLSLKIVRRSDASQTRSCWSSKILAGDVRGYILYSVEKYVWPPRLGNEPAVLTLKAHLANEMLLIMQIVEEGQLWFPYPFFDELWDMPGRC